MLSKSFGWYLCLIPSTEIIQATASLRSSLTEKHPYQIDADHWDHSTYEIYQPISML